MHTDMSGSAVALATLRGARAARRALAGRLLARDHREPHRPDRLPAAGSGSRLQRHDHPGHPQRCRGPHGAGRHAGTGRAQQAAADAGFRDADRRLRLRADRAHRAACSPTARRWPPRLEAAGRDSGERCGAFPMAEDYDTDIESTGRRRRAVRPRGQGRPHPRRALPQRFVPADCPGRTSTSRPRRARGGLGARAHRDHRLRRALRAGAAAGPAAARSAASERTDER